MPLSIVRAKYFEKYLGGCIEIVNPDAEEFLIASGAAVSQSREAVRQEGEAGRKVGLIKIKTIRPFPNETTHCGIEKCQTHLCP